jgi:hypothetical protein
MTKLYTLSYAKTKEDNQRTATLFYDLWETEGDNWQHKEQKSLSKLSRDEQIAHTDVLLSIMSIPGSQEDDIGARWELTSPDPLTPRIAVGVIDSVKELHTLSIDQDNNIIEASKTDPDERRFVQKDLAGALERLFKNVSEFGTEKDIFNIQKKIIQKDKPKTIRRKNGVA